MGYHPLLVKIRRIYDLPGFKTGFKNDVNY